jgi:hypothetical protein
MANPGWYPDPLGRAQVRYFDGVRWSQWAADNGQSRLDADAPLAGLADPPSLPPPGSPPPPPGAGTGWAGAPTVDRSFRSIAGLTTALTWVVGAAIVAALACAGAYVNHRVVGDRLYTDFSASRDDVTHARDIVNGFASLWGALAVATFVLIIIWLFRAVKNTQLWNADRGTWAPGWAIGGWFIPLANLVIPFLVFSSTWRRSDGSPAQRAPLPLIVWAWWILFVVGEIMIQIDFDIDSKSSLDARDTLRIVGFVVIAAAGAFLIACVRRMNRMQQDEHAALTTTSGTAWV